MEVQELFAHMPAIFMQITTWNLLIFVTCPVRLMVVEVKLFLDMIFVSFAAGTSLEREALKCFVQSAQVSRIERETRSNQSILTVLR